MACAASVGVMMAGILNLFCAVITPTEAAQAMMDDWARGVFEIHYPKRFTRVLKVLRCLPHRLYCWIVLRATGL